MYVFFIRHSHAIFYIPDMYLSLNSRDNLRETLVGPDGVVSSFTQLKPCPITGRCGVKVTTESITNSAAANSKGVPQASDTTNTSFSESVIAFDRGKYAIPPDDEVLTPKLEP